MLSNLGPLFKATFRQAEQTDTRMGIRQDDPHDQGRKKDPREKEDTPSDLWEDSMGVSIEALRTFLINFVGGHTAHVAGGSSRSASPAGNDLSLAQQPENRPPHDTRTARAVGAYQSMAEKTGGAYHPPPPPTPTSDVDLVHAEDVRIIHALIADLAALSAEGVVTLTLEKSDTFLHTLQDAVARARSGL